MRRSNSLSSRIEFAKRMASKHPKPAQTDALRHWMMWARQKSAKPDLSHAKNKPEFVIRKSSNPVNIGGVAVNKRRRLVNDESVVERGLRRFNKVGKRMTLNELDQLKRLVKKDSLANNKNTLKKISGELEAIKKIEAKKAYLKRRWQRRLSFLSSRDIDFPMIMNRKAFRQMGQKILNKSNPDEWHTLMEFDMDNLRKVNHLFGRMKGGHEFLLTFSTALAKFARKQGGFAGHVYGDEFFVYLPKPSGLVAELIMKEFEPIRQVELRKWKAYPQAEKQLKFNYSVGIFGMRNGHNIVDCMHESDGLCDKAKAKGRDKITFATREGFDGKITYATQEI